MSLDRDLRALLAAPDGMEPDPDPVEIRTLVEAWLAHRDATEEPHVRQSSAPFYASDATGCARQAAYNMLARAFDVPDSNPPTIADQWRFAMGNAAHDLVQSGAVATDPTAVEVRAVLPGEDGQDLVSSRGDLFFDAGATLLPDGTLVELKSAGGYKFKMMTTDMKGPAEGPSWAYVVQLALTARALEAQGKTITKGVVGVVAMENLAKSWRGVTNEIQRFAAQWTFSPAELRDIADKAISRLTRVRELVEAGELPPRNIDDPELPKRATVVAIPVGGKGRWEVRDGDAVVRSGQTWMCEYCRWADLCRTDLEAGA